MRSISTASVLRSLYLAERLASRPQVPGHLLLLASLDTSTALPAQLGLRCHEMVVLPAWRRSCPRDNDRLSLSDLLGDLTAWGCSSCCCSALRARGVAQAMPHGHRHRVRHAQRHRVRLHRRSHAHPSPGWSWPRASLTNDMVVCSRDANHALARVASDVGCRLSVLGPQPR